MLNVFHRDGDGIRHFWGSELFYAPTEPGQDTRHVGTLEPVWNIFDLNREGRRPDWDEQRTTDGPRRPSATSDAPQGSSGMRAMRCCRWALVLALVVAAPAHRPRRSSRRATSRPAWPSAPMDGPSW